MNQRSIQSSLPSGVDRGNCDRCFDNGNRSCNFLDIVTFKDVVENNLGRGRLGLWFRCKRFAGVIEGLSAEPPDGVAPDAAGEPSAGLPDGVAPDAAGEPSELPDGVAPTQPENPQQSHRMESLPTQPENPQQGHGWSYCRRNWRTLRATGWSYCRRNWRTSAGPPMESLPTQLEKPSSSFSTGWRADAIGAPPAEPPDEEEEAPDGVGGPQAME